MYIIILIITTLFNYFEKLFHVCKIYFYKKIYIVYVL